MFGKIGNYIAKVMKWGFETTVRFLRDYFGAFWALLVAIFTFTVELLDYPIRMINWALGRLDSLEVPNFDFTAPGIASNMLAIANTFFPLDEFFRYFVSYCIFYLIISAVRFIKSWIPTLSG